MAFRRFDAGSLRPPKRMADGRVRLDANITRTGVFEYLNPDGTVRREYRPPDEVFRDDSLETFVAVPFTDDHPDVPVTATNAKAYAVGWLGESVRRDGDHVVATIYVADAAVIAKIDAGKREVSCGYECDLEMAAGVTPSGDRYDAIQRNIRGNHVALVDRGRAGSARVRMDAAVMIPAAGERGTETNDPKEDPRMEELQKKLDAALADLAKVQTELASAKARADKAEGERDAATARADKAEASRMDEAAVQARVKARVDLERKAGALLDTETKLDGMSDRDIRVAVVKHVDGVDIAADKSDAYVEARFDAVVDRSAKADASLESARIVMIPGADPRRNDIADEDAAAEAMRKRRADAFKEGK
jgi:hypothetical protein